jgi:hypothetical protein
VLPQLFRALVVRQFLHVPRHRVTRKTVPRKKNSRTTGK